MPLEETQAGRHLSAGGGVVSGYMVDGGSGRSQTSTLLDRRGGGTMGGRVGSMKMKWDVVLIW